MGKQSRTLRNQKPCPRHLQTLKTLESPEKGICQSAGGGSVRPPGTSPGADVPSPVTSPDGSAGVSSHSCKPPLVSPPRASP